MSNCFELYGLDFLVDDSFKVYLLEVNPGPDFKQTGHRLRQVIVQLWEQTCQLVLDGTAEDTMRHSQDEMFSRPTDDFVKVYDKEWSAANIKSAMKLN